MAATQVRSEMLAPRKAPDRRTGLVGWLRANLFSSPLNSLVTLALAALLVRLIWPFLEWALFNANFLGESREACSSGGACWVYISARFETIIYGFYPPELRWRVNIVFVLLALVIAWLAIPRMPFKKWGALCALIPFPIAAFLLLHGGYFGITTVPTRDWGGLMLTITIALLAMVGSLPLGIMLALGRRSTMPFVRGVCVLFIEFWRGVPLITVLFMASVMLPLFTPSGFDLDKLLRALIGIMLFWSAYMAEAVRSGLQAIPSGQSEAASALGLGYWHRMILVVLPQALKLVIPGIVNTFIVLFMDTSLVLIIGLFDFLAVIRSGLNDPEWLGYAIEGYVFAALVYWIFCSSMSRYSQYIERRLHTGH
ncbi:amino acid ABC transporter permease [Kushneria aurantia]|uniref:Amino acid ABC transporter permease n=1 Tax=Kushneria aurantia TaxID=504092 RepID=A0ABV6G219_9GAMM|nr:amino acid ABC transporter permease [Kushneria aurantia]